MIYLDHAATAGPRAPEVIAAVTDVLASGIGNPGRSGHALSLRAARLLEESRCTAASFFGLSDPGRLIFTPGGTASINLVLRGYVRAGDTVLAGPWEHNAVMRPLRWMERTMGVRVEVIPPVLGAQKERTEPGERREHQEDEASGGPRGLDLDALRQRLESGPVRLVALLAASNVTGEAFPVRACAELAHAYGAAILVDDAQGAGVMDLHAERDGIDFLAATGHKSLAGPAGVGTLAVLRADELEPLVRGGTGSRSEEEEQPVFLPDRFEAGTPNLPGIAGLAAAIRLLQRTGTEAVAERHRRQRGWLVSRLRTLPGLVVHHPHGERGDDPGWLAVVSCGVPGRDPGLIARALDRRGIACRPGLHCAPRAHRTLGTWPTGTLRFSPGPAITEAEVETAVRTLAEVLQDVNGD